MIPNRNMNITNYPQYGYMDPNPPEYNDEEFEPLSYTNIGNPGGDIPGIIDSRIRRRKVTLNDFILIRVIGKGSYGKVMLVQCRLDGGIYAMKMLRKSNLLKRNQVQHTRTERAVLEHLNHPFIVTLVYAFQTEKKLYFVLEYCPGGELFFHLSRAGRFTENRARFYACEIVLALQHLHSLDIVYRDLKPENVLIDSEGHIRITDFGLSKEGIYCESSGTFSLCGTPEYIAPEVLDQRGHGKGVDWWSFGALLYEMIVGLPPFYNKDRDILFNNIKNGVLQFPSFVSPNAQHLIELLLDRNPNTRLGCHGNDAEEIKAHPFFNNINWENVLHCTIPVPFVPTIRGDLDVQNFDENFINLPLCDSEQQHSLIHQNAQQHMQQQQHYVFDGFTYDPLLDSDLFHYLH